MIDYSKWDKLELSDDSDVEVHPNVDKRSFIRWKQRDIHEKRQHNKLRSLQLEVNIETNIDLIERVDRLVELAKSSGLANVKGAVEYSCKPFTKDKPAKATAAEQPKYSDMIESLVSQVLSEASSPDAIVAKLNQHLSMIKGALADETKELQQLNEEKEKHITLEDVHTGFDSTIVYKAPTPAAGTTKKTEVEVINSPSEKKAPEKPKILESGLEELLPATLEFGNLKRGDFEAAFRSLGQHPEIISEGQKDALVMTAFDAELAGRSRDAERIVYNSTIIQYCALLSANGDTAAGVRALISKLVNEKHPARKAFEQEVESTYKHIQTRCKVLASEHDTQEPEREQIQLHSVDPNTQILVQVPEEGTPEREVYETLSPEIKTAIETKSLDEINKVLGELSVADAEALVGKFTEAGVLLVEDKIYDADEWQTKKVELEGEVEVEQEDENEK